MSQGIGIDEQSAVKIEGDDGTYNADVDLIEGKKCLQVCVNGDDDDGFKNDPRPPFFIGWSIDNFLDGSSENMAVSASTGSPDFFTFTAPAGKIIYISNITFYIAEAGGLVHDKFGNGSTLTNGIELEAQINGSTTGLGNNYSIKANGDVSNVFFNGTNTGSNNSFSGEIFLPPGRELTLDGNQSDFLRWRVQDDATDAIYIRSSLKYWWKL